MIAAIVPAKSLDAAKARLSDLLTVDERRGLALAMLGDVLTALKDVTGIDQIAVVSPDSDVLRAARGAGILAFAEPADASGLNAALDYACGQFTPRPEALIVLLADVPGIRTASIGSALAALDAKRGVVICPSGDGGTALLAQRPVGVTPFQFGPDSAEVHRRAAVEAAIEPVEIRLGAAVLDIDSPDDLRVFMSEPSDTATHRFLLSIGVEKRLRRGERVG